LSHFASGCPWRLTSEPRFELGFSQAYAGTVHAPSSGTGWERGFWFVFNRSTNPMCLIDEERRIVDVNDSTLAIIKRSRAQVIGSPAVDFIAPMDRAESEKRWRAILQTESGEFHGRGTVILGDGSELELDYAAHMVRISGRRLAIYVMLWDRDALTSLVTEEASAQALTQREREIVTAVALGHQTPEIAEELHISQETVRTHVRNLMVKTGTHTRAHLVAKVLVEGDVLHLPHLED
jgi:PAS domain S-box-containing protein